VQVLQLVPWKVATEYTLRLLLAALQSFPPHLARLELSLPGQMAVTRTSTVPSDPLVLALPSVQPAALLLPLRPGAALRGVHCAVPFPAEKKNIN
jgi:hypothetical protein